MFLVLGPGTSACGGCQYIILEIIIIKKRDKPVPEVQLPKLRKSTFQSTLSYASFRSMNNRYNFYYPTLIQLKKGVKDKSVVAAALMGPEPVLLRANDVVEFNRRTQTQSQDSRQQLKHTADERDGSVITCISLR